MNPFRLKSRPVHQKPTKLTARIIALEGIDQSGKQTQTRLLAHHLKRLGHKAETITYPIYNSPSGRQIRQFLNGKRDYSYETLHMLYSLNRWENKEMLYRMIIRDDFIVADRYSPSNLAYGTSRGLNLKWLQELDRGLPPPNLVILLDAPVGSSFARKSKDRDAHESNRQFLARVRQNYKMLSRDFGWKSIDATGTVARVESAIWNIVQKGFRLSDE